MFSSKSFIVSGPIFRSLIHFKFIFVYLAWRIPGTGEPAVYGVEQSWTRLMHHSSSSSVVLGGVLVSFFYTLLTSFPSTTC